MRSSDFLFMGECRLELPATGRGERPGGAAPVPLPGGLSTPWTRLLSLP